MEAEVKHEWVNSTLGHGAKMCRRCRATDREAAVLGLTECPEPKKSRGIFREAVVIDLRAFRAARENGAKPCDPQAST